MHAHYTITGLPGQLMQFFIVLIIFGYVVIAVQFWRKRNGNARARRALTELFLLFILCSLTGYLPRVFNVPTWFMFATHALLFAVTWRYVLSRQVEIIADSLERNRDGTKS